MARVPAGRRPSGRQKARPRWSTAASTWRALRPARQWEAPPAEVGWASERTCVPLPGNSLSERKNVLRLARAFEQRGEGSARLCRRRPAPRCVLKVGRGSSLRGDSIGHEAAPAWIAACDVLCQPSVEEPSDSQRSRPWRRPAPSSRRPSAGRPSSCRRSRRLSSSIPSTTMCSSQSLSQAAALPRPRPGEVDGGRRSRRQAAGGSGGGDPPGNCSRSASLTSTRGPITSSRSASRVTTQRLLVGSCWHLLGSDPPNSWLSPVTSSFWTAFARLVGHRRSVASRLPGGAHAVASDVCSAPGAPWLPAASPSS